MQTPLAQIQRAQLAVQVTPVGVRHAGVGGQDVEQVLAHDPGGDQLHGRDAHALLEAFGGARVVAAGHVAADVEPVPGRCHPAKQGAVAEHGAHQPEVVQMRAARVRVVEQIRVARGQAAVARDLLDHGPDGKRHGADEDGQPGRPLHQRVACGGVIQAVAGVAGFGNDRVERRAVERCIHLIGDLRQAPVQDGQGDRVGRHV